MHGFEYESELGKYVFRNVYCRILNANEVGVALQCPNTSREHEPSVEVRTRDQIGILGRFSGWIGIFDVSGILEFLAFGSQSLMGNPSCDSNDCCKTFQYVRGTTLTPNMSN